MSNVKYNGGCKSSLFDKLPEELRVRLDQSILARRVSTARLHHDLSLAAAGVTRSSLYRYARRLRQAADGPPKPPDLSNLDAQRRTAILDSWSIEMAHYRRNRAKAEDISVEHIKAKMEAGADALSVDDVCKLAAALARFKREDNAADRISASVHIAEVRAKPALAQKPQSPKHRYEPEAPWGRKEDGTPYTQEEFNEHLKLAMKEIYGINMTEDHFKPYPIVGGTLDLKTGAITPFAPTAPDDSPSPLASEIPNLKSSFASRPAAASSVCSAPAAPTQLDLCTEESPDRCAAQNSSRSRLTANG